MYGAIAYRLATAGTKPRGTVTVKRGAEILDGPYPKSFTDYIGQDLAVDQVLAAISSSARRDARLDHLLLDSGSPGIGKTALARLAAATRGVGFVEMGGAIKDKDVEKALKVMQDGDILFLDEIHRLGRGSEWLLTLMQDGVLQTPGGIIQAPDITVIGATTDGQRLPPAVLHRFKIRPMLVGYNNAEALQIAKLTAARCDFGTLLPMPESDVWLQNVAKASCNNPRAMETLLSNIRDAAFAGKAVAGPDGYDITTALKWNGITEDGLTRLAQEYMVGLWLNSGTAGISSLKAMLNTDNIKQTEDDLIRRGYVHVTPRGRELSDYGQERAQALAVATLKNMEDAA